MTTDTPEPMDRRPIASRERKVFQRMAASLARRRVSANAISVVGMFCGVAGGACLVATGQWSANLLFWLGAAAFIQLRLLANMLDGMVAIARGTASRVGELYNEVPDRVADVAVLAGAGYAAGSDVTLGWAAACVAMFVAYVRAMGKAAGGPNDFCGPMAKPHRMFVMTLTALYCGLAPSAWQPSWSEFGLPALVLALIVILGLVTVVRRLRRIAADLHGKTA